MKMSEWVWGWREPGFVQYPVNPGTKVLGELGGSRSVDTAATLGNGERTPNSQSSVCDLGRGSMKTRVRLHLGTSGAPQTGCQSLGVGIQQDGGSPQDELGLGVSQQQHLTYGTDHSSWGWGVGVLCAPGG